VHISGIKVLDKYTLQITLKHLDVLFLFKLAEPGASVIPKEVYEEMGAAEFSKHPVGAGPFKIASWKGNDITIEAFKDYYGGCPYLNKIEFKWMTEAGTRRASFEAEEIDAQLPSPIQYAQYEREIPDLYSSTPATSFKI